MSSNEPVVSVNISANCGIDSNSIENIAVLRLNKLKEVLGTHIILGNACRYRSEIDNLLLDVQDESTHSYILDKIDYLAGDIINAMKRGL